MILSTLYIIQSSQSFDHFTCHTKQPFMHTVRKSSGGQLWRITLGFFVVFGIYPWACFLWRCLPEGSAKRSSHPCSGHACGLFPVLFKCQHEKDFLAGYTLGIEMGYKIRLLRKPPATKLANKRPWFEKLEVQQNEIWWLLPYLKVDWINMALHQVSCGSISASLVRKFLRSAGTCPCAILRFDRLDILFGGVGGELTVVRRGSLGHGIEFCNITSQVAQSFGKLLRVSPFFQVSSSQWYDVVTFIVPTATSARSCQWREHQIQKVGQIVLQSRSRPALYGQEGY